MRYITAKKLEKWDACGSQIELFKELFDDRASLTIKSLQRAFRHGIDLTYPLDHAIGPASDYFRTRDAELKRLYPEIYIRSQGCACGQCVDVRAQILEDPEFFQEFAEEYLGILQEFLEQEDNGLVTINGFPF
jgi:hypothetical protein